MKKKGFTLIELLVVIAIIALLMGILMPALARVRLIAYRMVCGSNLSGIGKAIMLYAGDADDQYPMPGCRRPAIYAPQGHIRDWADIRKEGACGAYAAGQQDFCGWGTVGSVFYLLVKYEDLSVKNFNCKGDTGVKTFSLSDSSLPGLETFTQAWDFGAKPGIYNSYSYNNPFADNEDCGGGFRVTAASPPGTPVAADRNPTLDRNVDYIEGGQTEGGTATEEGAQTPLELWETMPADSKEYLDLHSVYNSYAHQREGQNVLFNDGHVNFEETANVGINSDNIWQKWPQYPLSGDGLEAKKQREVGGFFPEEPTAEESAYNNYDDIVRMAEDDALLINEHQDSGSENF